MKLSERQRVHATNDEGLRHLIHENLKVIAKFTSLDCAVCEALSPAFSQYADDARYAAIVFLRLDADENPVAKKMMQDKVAPFFVSYCQGRLLECDALTSEAEVVAQLDRLLAFQPVGH